MSSNYDKPARVGWVHPKKAAGLSAKEAALEAGAGNITAEPPASEEVNNPRPSIDPAEYPTPRDSGGMADGETGGNYEQGKIPDLQVHPGEGEEED